jgi:polysaccharide export outer membrane protein
MDPMSKAGRPTLPIPFHPFHRLDTWPHVKQTYIMMVSARHGIAAITTMAGRRGLEVWWLAIAIALLVSLRIPIPAADAEPPVAGPPVAGPPEAPTAADPSYALYPGDRMQISVFDYPDLTIQIHVPTDGVISFPLIGDVTGLVGRTVEDLRGELKRRLEDGYITQAIVTVSFLDFGPRSAYIMGNVANPSIVPLSPFAPLTAIQAISKAGGFSEGADRAAARVLRDDPTTGKKVAIPVQAAEGDTKAAADVVLKPGDLIVVPRKDRIFILGQVRRPGAVDLPGQEELTVSKAISLAGGFDRFGRQDEVQVIRAGTPVRLVDVHKILAGDRRVEDVVLKPGDTVFVPETRF